ncbi:AzlC family ABC transporter permease [Gleimia hominis]|uniref:AzlC family ABC transporter permease n=1 Tax=Gleimia hominis TaxID=595468 RepID=A0ABU3I9I1_9ACTO|nr:AzlC family ABC transporter permease [Gleimia hominis]MDT3766596.1 AzlC family ABC transporter permease [Gleimia hominis]
MARSSSSSSTPGFGTAVKLSLPVAAGYLPLGIGYGMYTVAAGISWWWIIPMSLLVYSGATQFVLTGLISAHAGLVEVAFTAFFVGFRHVFYGLSFPLRLVRSKLGRLYGVHALTDETYAVLTMRKPGELTGKVVLWTQFLNHSYWLFGSVVGGLLMRGMHFDASFMAFSLTALFVVLAMDSYRQNPRPLVLLVAVVCAVIGLAAGKDLMLIVALLSFTLVLTLRVNALPGGRFRCHFGSCTARRGDSSIGRSGDDFARGGGGSEPRLFPDRTDVGP